MRLWKKTGPRLTALRAFVLIGIAAAGVALLVVVAIQLRRSNPTEVAPAPPPGTFASGLWLQRRGDGGLEVDVAAGSAAWRHAGIGIFRFGFLRELDIRDAHIRVKLPDATGGSGPVSRELARAFEELSRGPGRKPVAAVLAPFEMELETENGTRVHAVASRARWRAGVDGLVLDRAQIEGGGGTVELDEVVWSWSTRRWSSRGSFVVVRNGERRRHAPAEAAAFLNEISRLSGAAT